MVYICVGTDSLWQLHPVFQLVKLDCVNGKSTVQDCVTATFIELVLIKGVWESLILGAYGEKDGECKPESGKLYQKIQLCWRNDCK